jgi:DNA-binding beta-propeller fold protein YncE
MATLSRRTPKILVRSLAAALLMGSFAAAQGDSEKNFPNVLAPLYEFGRTGAEPGALTQPAGLAVGKEDLLYVADCGNHRIQLFSVNGQSRGAFGTCGTGPSEFVFPTALALSSEGELCVADAGGRLQVFSEDRKPLQSWDGLRSPRGAAVSGDRIYVTEGEAHQVRVFPRKGGASRVFGGPGSQPGRFLSPAGVAVDEDGVVYVADSGNHRIQKLDPEGKPLGQWGAWGGQAGLLSYPAGIAYSRGLVYVADYANHRVQVFDRNGALIRQWGAAPPRPGEGKGRFHFPDGIAVSPSGGLVVVSEPVENRIQVFINRDLQKTRRVNDLPWWDSVHARLHTVRLAPPPPGCPTQVAGTLGADDVHAVFFFDVSAGALGPIVAAGGFGRKLGELNGIGGVVVDPDRNRVVVSDRGNLRIVLLDLPRDAKRPELFNNTIRVVAAVQFVQVVQNPPPGYAPEKAVPGPLGRDARGRFYILDRSNAAVVVCDGDLKFLKLFAVSPTTQEIAVDADGTVYATDPAAFQVQVYDADGKRKSAWGRRDEKDAAAFRMPYGIALDDHGAVYVADPLDVSVKKFDRDGKLLKRWGTPGRIMDALLAPRGVTFCKPDRLIVEDYGNHRAQVYTTEGVYFGNYVAGGLATPITIR